MPCYFLAQLLIHDRETYVKYLAGTAEPLRKYGGEVLAVDEAPAVLEGEWPYTRVIAICFRDKEAARRWYDSPEYRGDRQVPPSGGRGQWPFWSTGGKSHPRQTYLSSGIETGARLLDRVGVNLYN